MSAWPSGSLPDDVNWTASGAVPVFGSAAAWTVGRTFVHSADAAAPAVISMPPRMCSR